MNLSDQVCSLEYAKKLQEFGINADSHFSYYKSEIMKEYDLCQRLTAHILNDRANEIYPAYSVSELGELLPSCVNEFFWVYITNWHEFEIQYKDDNHHVIAEIQDKKEADARAKMIIFLIENGLVKIEDINN